METKVGIFTSVCEADQRWFDQYLKEVERLGFDFAIHFDKCSFETRKKFTSHPRCVGYTEKAEGEFSEKDKQGILDLLVRLGYDWALAWDVDETWENDAPAKFARLDQETADIIYTNWVNLWEDSKHIRRDGPYQSGKREKVRNLKRFRWTFKNDTVNGPSADKEGYTFAQYMDLDCIHWGMITAEIRQEHKDRWDRIYGHYTDGGKNPYGFWEYSVDPNIKPLIQKYDRT